jgi:hypothetical protein
MHHHREKDINRFCCSMYFVVSRRVVAAVVDVSPETIKVQNHRRSVKQEPIGRNDACAMQALQSHALKGLPTVAYKNDVA